MSPHLLVLLPIQQGFDCVGVVLYSNIYFNSVDCFDWSGYYGSRSLYQYNEFISYTL